MTAPRYTTATQAGPGGTATLVVDSVTGERLTSFLSRAEAEAHAERLNNEGDALRAQAVATERDHGADIVGAFDVHRGDGSPLGQVWRRSTDPGWSARSPRGDYAGPDLASSDEGIAFLVKLGAPS